MKRTDNIIFVIHPTIYQDYNILAIGLYDLLEQLSHKCKDFHLIKKSRYGGIPILIMDTSDTLKDAKSLYNHYRTEYTKLTERTIQNAKSQKNKTHP